MTDPRRLSRPTVVVVGPRVIPEDVPGGSKVAFEGLLNDFARSERYHVQVVNTSRGLRDRSRPVQALLDAKTLLRTLHQVRRLLPAEALMFNVSSRGALLAGPVIWALARRHGTPIITRMFGGDLGDFLGRAPWPVRKLAERTFVRSDRLLLETWDLMKAFGVLPNVRQFPNTRDLPTCSEPMRPQCRKFLFLSQLRPHKGLGLAIDGSDALPPGCALSVYGPVMPGTDIDQIDRHPNAMYGGPVAYQDILSILCAHDALVFPTYYSGEGIPGVVIEALQCGLPVITTNWKSMPVIVQHGLSGLIVPPRSLVDLREAMVRLATDRSLFSSLQRGARERGEDFRRGRWHERLEQWLDEIIHPDTTRGLAGTADR